MRQQLERLDKELERLENNSLEAKGDYTIANLYNSLAYTTGQIQRILESLTHINDEQEKRQ